MKGLISLLLLREPLYAEVDESPTQYENLSGEQRDDAAVELSNCSVAMVDEFPRDLFSQDERLHSGAIALHFIATLVAFHGFAIVCDNYFVPSVQQLAHVLNMRSDIAGATLMGWVTSTPEIFTNVIGVFIMKGDMGIGTIVGSSIFNHLAIFACIGLATNKPVVVDPWPMKRDVTFYGLSVAALLVVLWDERIYWYESVGLLALYGLYIWVMYHDSFLEQWVAVHLPSASHPLCSHYFCHHKKQRRHFTQSNQQPPLPSLSTSQVAIVSLCGSTTFSIHEDNTSSSTGSGGGLCSVANKFRLASWDRMKRWMKVAVRLSGVPLSTLFALTIPDFSNKSSTFGVLLTFLISTLWISLLSYLSTWMMTVVAHTYRVKDTVFGVSMIAAGTSLPEAVSSIIVARRGLGTMATSTGVGSNTFNMLVCLGLPWLIRALLNLPDSSYARVDSFALWYSTFMCGLSILPIQSLLSWNNFQIDTKVALASLALYLCFLTLDALLQLNVLAQLNLPICH